MNLCRFTVKCLAWVVLYLGGAMTVGSLLFMLAVASGYVGAFNPKIDRSGLIFLCTACAVMATLSYLIARSAWKHLRKPDQKSANSVVGLAGFFLGIETFQQITKHGLLPKPDGTWGPTLELLCFLGVLVAAYLLYRLVLKRIAARAFPAGDTSPTPLSSGSTP